MKKRILMLMAAICMICSFAAITVGAYTDYTANAQKLVSYIWQKGYVSNDGTISLTTTSEFSEATKFTILRYDPQKNQIHFGSSLQIKGGSTLCYFNYDVATASVVDNELDVSVFFDENGSQTMAGVTLFFDANTYNEDDQYDISPNDIYGDAYLPYGSFDEVASFFNRTIHLAIVSFENILSKYTDLSLEDIGFVSLRVTGSNNDTISHAPDGRTARIYHGDVEKFLQVGWYLYPVTTIYAPDGRTAVVEKSSVEAYKAVGWNTVPAITLYALNGSTINIWSSETAAYTAVGWYVGTTPITMYAPDGRTISVPIEQMTAYIGVGWSQYPIAA